MGGAKADTEKEKGGVQGGEMSGMGGKLHRLNPPPPLSSNALSISSLFLSHCLSQTSPTLFKQCKGCAYRVANSYS